VNTRQKSCLFARSPDALFLGSCPLARSPDALFLGSCPLARSPDALFLGSCPLARSPDALFLSPGMLFLGPGMLFLGSDALAFERTLHSSDTLLCARFSSPSLGYRAVGRLHCLLSEHGCIGSLPDGGLPPLRGNTGVSGRSLCSQPGVAGCFLSPGLSLSLTVPRTYGGLRRLLRGLLRHRSSLLRSRGVLPFTTQVHLCGDHPRLAFMHRRTGLPDGSRGSEDGSRGSAHVLRLRGLDRFNFFLLSTVSRHQAERHEQQDWGGQCDPAAPAVAPEPQRGAAGAATHPGHRGLEARWFIAPEPLQILGEGLRRGVAVALLAGHRLLTDRNETRVDVRA
jgi:hypothetical protein